MPVDINTITLSGTLSGDTREAVVGDSHVVNRELTFTTPGKDGETRENYIELQAWGNVGDALARPMSGEQLIVSGSLLRKAWKDKDDNWRSKHSIRVVQIQEFGAQEPDIASADAEPPAEKKDEPEFPFE